MDSVNPDLIDGAAGEADRALRRRVAEAAGLEVEVEEWRRALQRRRDRARLGRWQDAAPERAPGHGRRRGHGAPFEPVVENGRMHGRGSYDMKAGLAAIMVAGAEAARAGLRGDVIVTAVCDEEVASIGTARVAERRAHAAILSRPRCGSRSRPGASSASRSRRRAARRTVRAGPGRRPIAHMGHVLVGIESLDARLRADPTHPLLGAARSTRPVIEGGQEFSSYPERCLLKGERRTSRGIRAGRGRAPGAARRSTARSASSSRGSRSRRPRTRPSPSSSPATPASRRSSASLLPTRLSSRRPASPRSSSARPARAPAVEEWVDLASAERCAEIYSAVARELCA